MQRIRHVRSEGSTNPSAERPDFGLFAFWHPHCTKVVGVFPIELGANMNWTKRFFDDESGATSIEYAFVASLILAVCIGTVAVMGGSLNELFVMSRDQLQLYLGG